jgi:hypothetical protein
MDKLKLSDIDRLISLAINAKSEHGVINDLENFKKIITSDKNQKNRSLTEDEVKKLCSNESIKRYMILLFLAENIVVEHLRLKYKPFKGEVILISKIWKEVEEMLSKKLSLSREINFYFKGRGGRNGEDFKAFIALSKTFALII